jgi:hypothetical protein
MVSVKHFEAPVTMSSSNPSPTESRLAVEYRPRDHDGEGKGPFALTATRPLYPSVPYATTRRLKALGCTRLERRFRSIVRVLEFPFPLCMASCTCLICAGAHSFSTLIRSLPEWDDPHQLFARHDEPSNALSHRGQCSLLNRFSSIEREHFDTWKRQLAFTFLSHR